ncbi:MAG TPA: alpha/beta fold hydrolase [Candidatus Gastranaerophilaceae bacterium]|nr:alpha/beta fold hydrolase [Candidatus Gastranaerophilaceae bacterium]HPT41981.1 alpha/beta fold hydrolase [Candidatus Gastranaerophilaceae bacterium]
MKQYSEIYLKAKVKLALNHYKRNKEQVLLIAPGWTMSKDSKFIKQAAIEFAKTFDVISFDFRGHGRSSGFYTFSKKEPDDLNAVVDYAKGIYKKVYVIGFSMGGAISIIQSAAQSNADCLIIVSAPHSFEKIKNVKWIKDFLTNPFKKYEFKKWIRVRVSPIIQKMVKPIDVVDKINCPTLFIAGDNDTIILPDDTKSLFEKAKCKKEFELFEGCNHAEDLIYQQKEKFIKTCTNWLCSCLRTA